MIYLKNVKLLICVDVLLYVLIQFYEVISMSSSEFENKGSLTIIIGDSPYGCERPYSALRFTLAALLDEVKTNIFLIEDGVYLGIKNQSPAEYPNKENLLQEALTMGAEVKACGPCCKARGVLQEDVIEGIKLATIHDLIYFVIHSDKTIFF